MAKILVVTKVREAADLLATVVRGRRPARPGDRVQYITHGEDGSGQDIVELVRRKEPGVYLQNLRKWLFRTEIALLPKDRWRM